MFQFALRVSRYLISVFRSNRVLSFGFSKSYFNDDDDNAFGVDIVTVVGDVKGKLSQIFLGYSYIYLFFFQLPFSWSAIIGPILGGSRILGFRRWIVVLGLRSRKCKRRWSRGSSWEPRWWRRRKKNSHCFWRWRSARRNGMIFSLTARKSLMHH